MDVFCPNAAIAESFQLRQCMLILFMTESCRKRSQIRWQNRRNSSCLHKWNYYCGFHGICLVLLQFPFSLLDRCRRLGFGDRSVPFLHQVFVPSPCSAHPYPPLSLQCRITLWATEKPNPNLVVFVAIFYKFKFLGARFQFSQFLFYRSHFPCE